MDDSAKPNPGANRWRRFADWDERPLRLDRFAVEDAENGFAAFKSPNDPKPGLEMKNGRVVSLDVNEPERGFRRARIRVPLLNHLNH